MSRGRPREFDTALALDRALLVFWKKGYRGTSLDDLTEAMQINRPSLYAAFGDKEQLFLSAVDRYRDKYIVPNVKKLVGEKSLRKALSEFFRGMAGVIKSEENPPGCLIACLLSEECCESEVIRAKLGEAIAGADARFQMLYEQYRDELPQRLEPAVAAKMTTTLIHGLSIRARSGASKPALLKIADGFIDNLLQID